MNFLISSQWRQFQESAGRKTFDVGKDGYAVKMELPLGKSYLYSNYPDTPKHLDEIKKIAKQEGAVFIKFEPMALLQGEIRNLREFGFRHSLKELQPQRTIILDLIKDESQILAKMHQKTRYNIRLAGKRGIKISEAKNKGEYFEEFWKLLSKTAQRDKFHTHTKEYYKKLLALDITKLYFAYKHGEGFHETHAAAVAVFFGGRATYLHGASDYKYRRDMAPHLLHWKIIQDAKDAGMEEYDLWGIDKKKWPGVSRFKQGFGGREVEYIGSWDFPINKFWYTLYRWKNKV